MNTENNQTILPGRAKQVMDQIFDQLDKCTANMPIELMLNELQIAVERFSFRELTNPGATELNIIDVNKLLQHDVSPGVMAFIEWTTQQRIGRLFIGNSGRLFLSYCTRRYRDVPEILVSTPVTLRPDYQSQLNNQLRQVHPLPSRIIFRVVPSLVVGCMIKSPNNAYDYSLKRTMLADIARFSQRLFLSMENIRG